MTAIIKKLPDDLKRILTAYTYRPQNAELLDDIRDYGITRVLLERYIAQICRQITIGDTHDDKIYTSRLCNTKKIFLKRWRRASPFLRSKKLAVLSTLINNPIPICPERYIIVLSQLFRVLTSNASQCIRIRQSIENMHIAGQDSMLHANPHVWHYWLRSICTPPKRTHLFKKWKALGAALYPDIDWGDGLHN